MGVNLKGLKLATIKKSDITNYTSRTCITDEFSNSQINYYSFNISKISQEKYPLEDDIIDLIPDKIRSAVPEYNFFINLDGDSEDLYVTDPSIISSFNLVGGYWANQFRVFLPYSKRELLDLIRDGFERVFDVETLSISKDDLIKLIKESNYEWFIFDT